MPVCTGDKCDALEHASLIQQWRAACHLEKLAGGGAPGTGNGQPDWTKVTGDGTDGAGQDPDGPVVERSFDPTKRLDTAGFFGGNGSCPTFGVLHFPFGFDFDLDSKPWACDLFYITRMFLTLLAVFIALGILMGWKI